MKGIGSSLSIFLHHSNPYLFILALFFSKTQLMMVLPKFGMFFSGIWDQPKIGFKPQVEQGYAATSMCSTLKNHQINMPKIWQK